jgi:hypothetical protein
VFSYVTLQRVWHTEHSNPINRRIKQALGRKLCLKSGRKFWQTGIETLRWTWVVYEHHLTNTKHTCPKHSPHHKPTQDIQRSHPASGVKCTITRVIKLRTASENTQCDHRRSMFVQTLIVYNKAFYQKAFFRQTVCPLICFVSRHDLFHKQKMWAYETHLRIMSNNSTTAVRNLCQKVTDHSSKTWGILYERSNVTNFHIYIYIYIYIYMCVCVCVCVCARVCVVCVIHNVMGIYITGNYA